MQTVQVIRRLEQVFILLLVALYVTRELYTETMLYNSLLTAWPDMEGYNHGLNTVLPVIAGTVLLVVAWYLFHYLVYPIIATRDFKPKLFLYLVLVMVCVAMGIFLYYYFKLYIHFRYNEQGTIIGITIDSPYRKLTVFSDIIGALIILGLYEFFAQLYYYLHQELIGEQETSFKYISYFFLTGIAALCLIFAVFGSVPAPLWEGKSAFWLLLGGFFIWVYVLQEYVFYFLFPYLQTPDFKKLIRNLLVYLLLHLTGLVLIWGSYSHFSSFSYRAVALLYFILVFASGAMAYLRSILFREKKVLQTQVSVKSAELSSLRSQINPHFLFNALNSLYATALKENSEKTADGIQKLGDMMRFMLQENNQEQIPLRKEIAYLHNYMAIQRLRIDESQGIEVRVNLQEPAHEIYLAPMLLNPFVENAFKHGISLESPSWIFITLTLDATRLYFKVHNSLHARREKDPEKNSPGVGLTNVKKRLELIYPDRHTLTIQQSEKDYFVSLTLVVNETI